MKIDPQYSRFDMLSNKQNDMCTLSSDIGSLYQPKAEDKVKKFYHKPPLQAEKFNNETYKQQLNKN